MTADDLVSDQDHRARLASDLHASFFVEAAAGTGKTRELVERTVALLAEGVARVDRLAVITFTEKAAGELQLRLREALDAARAEAPPEVRTRLEAAIARLEEATIDTIHGFCREILRTRPVEARVDPDFVVDGDGSRLRARVFGRWFADRLQDPPPGLARFLARNRVTRPDETPTKALEQALEAIVAHRDLPAPWPRPEIDVEAEVIRLAETVAPVAALLRRGPSDDPLRVELAALVDFADELGTPEALRAADPAELEAALVDLRQLLKPRYEKSVAWAGKGPFADGVGRFDVHRAARDLLEALGRFETVAAPHLAATLADELREAGDRALALARRSGRLDFQYLLLIARDLVRDDPAARRALQDRFRHILVDEFQDTDPLQAEIVLLLAADDPAETDFRKVRPVPGKLTLVGDPKQSIYGFRRADLGLYAEVERALLAGGAERLTLARSHRASAPIQALVNEAFAEPLTPSPDDPVRAQQPGYVPLLGGPPPIDGQPAVVALPIARPFGRSPGRTWASVVAKRAPQTVAAFVAWLVQESGWRVRGEEGALRPLTPSDVCLLFKKTRSGTKLLVPEFQAALEAHGVENVLVGARILHDRDEIEILLTALSALEWPDDELMVYGALTGPLFGFTDADLWRHRRTRGLHPFRAPDETRVGRADDGTAGPSDPEARAADPTAGPDASGPGAAELEVGAAIEAALALLRDLSRSRNRRPFAETIEGLLRATRAHVGLGLRPAGSQVLAHVDRVIDLARAYEADEGVSFRGFVEHLREVADEPRAHDGAINEESAPGVRLMTVHRAKGLEFPVVVLADVASGPSNWPDKHVDPAAGIAAFKVGGLVPQPLITNASTAQAKNAAESLRQAYVAATRARDLLVVPTVGVDLSGLLKQSWLAPVLAAIHPPPKRARAAAPCPGAPTFGTTTVRLEADERFPSVAPGVHLSAAGGFEVAWWDPLVLPSPPSACLGIADEAFLAPGPTAEASVETHAAWIAARDEERATGGEQSVALRDLATLPADGLGRFPVSERRLGGAEERPRGRRFGQLVHRVLRDVDLGAGDDEVRALVALHARALDAAEDERAAAASAVIAFLADELVARARAAPACHRDFGVVHVDAEGLVTDTRLDLVFEEEGELVAVDLVTGAPEPDRLRSKMSHALVALEAAGRTVRAGIVLHL